MNATDFADILPHLAPVELPKSLGLVFPDQRIEHCWFLEDGIASLVATSNDGRETEAGIVGQDGMVDVATILGADQSPLTCLMQVAGYGYRLPVTVLRNALSASAEMRFLLNRYAYACFVDLSQTALANAAFTVEERLARWLLMCADRLGRNDIPLTHELLSIMLNVRRAGITSAVHSLEAAGCVSARRGSVTIVDRSALQRLSHEAYRPITRD